MPRITRKRDLDRFLHHLARTGNFALAADRTGRAKSGLYKRRARDAHFAALCEAALAAFRFAQCKRSAHPEEGPSSPGSNPGRIEGPSRRIRTAPGDLTLSPLGRRRPAQLRRSPAGRLTHAGLAAFLKTLAATANVRLAAQGVGVAASSIYKRRNADPVFARAINEALAIAYDRLECELIASAEGAFDDALDEGACLPLDLSLSESKTTVGQRPSADPLILSLSESKTTVGQQPFNEKMTIDQVLQLLRLHHRTARLGWAHRDREHEEPSWQEVERYFTRELRRRGVKV